MRTLVFTGGGTLGHCLPNLAVYEYLKDSFDKFYYFGSYNGAERKTVEGIFEYMPITTTKFSRSLSLSNLKIPFLLKKGVNEAIAALKRINPDVVFSKGGFVSVPTVLAAARLGVPVVSHESDLSIGLANRLTARRSVYVLTSFSSTAKALKNGVFTGPPIRSEALKNKREEGKKAFGISGDKPVLLVIGGSSGAKTINDFIISHLDELTQTYSILHICGNKHTTDMKKQGYCQIGFVKDVALVYSVADYAVSRCGSGVAFELLTRKIPTLFIPLPKKASRGDQIENARYFEARGLSLTLNEDDMNIYSFVQALNSLSQKKHVLIRNMQNANYCSSAEKIAKIVIDVAQGKRV